MNIPLCLQNVRSTKLYSTFLAALLFNNAIQKLGRNDMLTCNYYVTVFSKMMTNDNFLVNVSPETWTIKKYVE